MALQQQMDKARDVVPRSMTFLQEVWSELKKVHWPGRKEVWSATVVVLAVVVILAVFLGVVDYVATRLVRFILTA
jgi:preprotein translocase subunit SecE